MQSHTSLFKIRAWLREWSQKPQFLALIPAVMVGAFWLGGEAALVSLALFIPAVFAALGCFAHQQQEAIPSRDRLTGLRLREAVETALEKFASGPREPGVSTACMRIDLDDFHSIADQIGHVACDELVLQTSQRLKNILRHDDVLARLDGGSFAIAFAPVRRADLENMVQISARLQRAASEAIQINSSRISLTATIGFCLEATVKPSELLHCAEQALQEARQYAPSGLRAYSRDLKNRIETQSKLLTEVAAALENGQIRAWFQPQVSTDTGQITGFEALARWQHPKRGMIGPAEFLPAIQQAGLSERLSEVILFQSLSALRNWDAVGFHIDTIGVNFSSDELQNTQIVDKVAWELDKFDLLPGRLSIEVLENVVTDSANNSITRNIRGLADLGCKIELDDFGTGHASISNIRRFTVNRLKIDRSFITKIDKDPEQHQMVSAILTMAERLDLETIAEGVETHDEHATLAQLGCSHVQGYSISKPMPLEDTLPWLEQHQVKLRKTADISRKLG